MAVIQLLSSTAMLAGQPVFCARIYVMHAHKMLALRTCFYDCYYREALIEKKAARREAARERDASPDLVKLPGGGDVMGGDDSLAAAKARQARPSLMLSLPILLSL